MEDIRKELGHKGELFVANHLEKDGFEIRSLNYRSKTGEIDVIAQKKELIVFVEGKSAPTGLFQSIIGNRLLKTAKDH